MPGPETRPLFEEAQQLSLGFHLGYAELTVSRAGDRDRFNTSILVDKQAAASSANIARSICPARPTASPGRPGQHLEKHYFEVGDLGFGVWRAFGGIVGMCICNDRRWPETYRVMGLQGVEMIMLGYNSPVGLGDTLRSRCARAVPQPPGHAVGRVPERHLGDRRGEMRFRGRLPYDRAERDHRAFRRDRGDVPYATSDELAVRRCDLDFGTRYKDDIFNFAAHRRPEHYRLIVDRTGAIPPPEQG